MIKKAFLTLCRPIDEYLQENGIKFPELPISKPRIQSKEGVLLFWLLCTFVTYLLYGLYADSWNIFGPLSSLPFTSIYAFFAAIHGARHSVPGFCLSIVLPLCSGGIIISVFEKRIAGLPKDDPQSVQSKITAIVKYFFSLYSCGFFSLLYQPLVEAAAFANDGLLWFLMLFPDVFLSISYFADAFDHFAGIFLSRLLFHVLDALSIHVVLIFIYAGIRTLLKIPNPFAGVFLFVNVCYTLIMQGV